MSVDMPSSIRRIMHRLPFVVPLFREHIGFTLALPVILIGLFISSRSGQALITAGIICFSLAVLFQIVTLPRI